jgi:predicted DNA-binding protein (MmcQ/YjbR family)
MNIEEFREYCLSKPATTEEMPFGEDTLVFKVMGKIFALTSLDSEVFSFNLKCDPEKAIQLRETYACVQPGYHMNKQHWNTIRVDGSVSRKELCDWIDHSYKLVVSKLTRAQKQALTDTIES